MVTFRKLLLVKKIISSGYAYEMNKKTTNTTSKWKLRYAGFANVDTMMSKVLLE